MAVHFERMVHLLKSFDLFTHVYMNEVFGLCNFEETIGYFQMSYEDPLYE